MNTDNETMAKTTTSDGTGGFPEAYIRLRTVLDALEMNALNYILEDKHDAARTNRAAEAEALLRKCYKDLFALREPDVQAYGPAMPELSGGNCPSGYHNCDGVCVPYQCP